MVPQRMQQVINALLAAGTISLAVFTGITATTGSFTNLTATNATITNLTTAGAVTSTLGSFTVGTLNVTSTIHSVLTSSTRQIVGQGSSVDLLQNATTSLNPAAIAPGQVTSTVLTLSRVTAGDFCWPSAISGSLSESTSTARMWAVAGAGQATVYMTNASSTGAAYDASTSVLGATCLSF